jgi:hypothetical protein
MATETDRATYAPITDHVAAGLALLTQRWRGLPNVEGVLSAWLAEVQEIEDAIAAVMALTIDTAADDQLAQYGKLLGVTDPGNFQFKALIRAATLANGSSGTGNELHAVLAAAETAGSYSITEYFPAALVIEPETVSNAPASMVHAIAKRAVAGGVRLLTIDVPASGFVFAFSDTDETVTDAACGLSDVAGLVGGQLVGVMD